MLLLVGCCSLCVAWGKSCVVVALWCVLCVDCWFGVFVYSLQCIASRVLSVMLYMVCCALPFANHGLLLVVCNVLFVVCCVLRVVCCFFLFSDSYV